MLAVITGSSWPISNDIICEREEITPATACPETRDVMHFVGNWPAIPYEDACNADTPTER